ncbi:MAG: M23 family metallopeptidase [Lentimicrobium sp.]|jgi:murein DD-endopeptidase MepM/ murein hydrolase activator NlpD|nr:M23 family metallopeptidase [Lentimicrobium sp.]
MRFTRGFLILIPALVLLISNTANANDKDKKFTSINLRTDTTNIYQGLLNDDTDDLMENHPADDIYNNIWTSSKLNPYKIPIDSLPDSVKVDLSTFCVPVMGHITSHFGPRRYRYHYGTDIKLNTGDTVVSSFAGKIRIIDYDRRGYGHYVVIRHDNGLETVYAHLSEIMVTLDQVVEAGEPIALGGSTGRSTGPHLHYEIRFLGNAMNPAKIIDFACGSPFDNEYLITKKHSFYYQKEVKAMAAAKYYKIRSGDNLSRIAARNGTSVKTLCRLNGISSKKILRIGQTIRVR